MIKYTLCPVETQLTSDTLTRGKEYIAKVFKHLEKENMEEHLYNVQIGQKILLYSFEYASDDFVRTYFTSTGVNSGYFTQHIVWPGRSDHYNSFEFTFE